MPEQARSSRNWTEEELHHFAMDRLTEDMQPDITWRSEGERLIWQAEQEGRAPSEEGARR